MMHVDAQVKYLAGCLFFAPVKNRKTRDVPVADPVIPVLAEHVRQYPPVKVTLPWGAPDGKPVTRELMFTTRTAGRLTATLPTASGRPHGGMLALTRSGDGRTAATC
jgi:hypothetical protein